MNQKKIGEFIAELRKGKGLTQRQLADAVGVSDKTISKWECGNGLPEMSNIPILCDVLGININELLSGERLEQEIYTEKAEENMMTLMQETAEHKRKNRSALATVMLSLFGVVLAVSLATWFAEEISILAFLDFPTFLPMLIVTAGVLCVGRAWKPFWKSFSLMGKETTGYTKQELADAIKALSLAAKAMLVAGVITSMSSVILLFAHISVDSFYDIEVLFKNVAIALLGILYGVSTYLFLLPLKSCLCRKMED